MSSLITLLFPCPPNAAVSCSFIFIHLWYSSWNYYGRILVIQLLKLYWRLVLVYSIKAFILIILIIASYNNMIFKYNSIIHSNLIFVILLELELKILSAYAQCNASKSINLFNNIFNLILVYFNLCSLAW